MKTKFILTSVLLGILLIANSNVWATEIGMKDFKLGMSKENIMNKIKQQYKQRYKIELNTLIGNNRNTIKLENKLSTISMFFNKNNVLYGIVNQERRISYQVYRALLLAARNTYKKDAILLNNGAYLWTFNKSRYSVLCTYDQSTSLFSTAYADEVLFKEYNK